MELHAVFIFIFFFISTCSAFENIQKSSDFKSNNDTDGKNSSVVCVREHVYDKMDIREVLGKWKVLEVYTHLINEGVQQYRTCPDITIWETDDFPMTTFGPSMEHQLHHVQHINAKFHQEYRHLRLLWDEAGQTIEYALYFRNDSVGYWQVFDGQNGTATLNRKYQQFSGSIQVLKAVQDHLVLNFCQEEVNGKPAQFYTVLFSREPGTLSYQAINSIHFLLQDKQLSTASRRMVCGNSAARSLYSIILSVVLLAVTYTTSS